MAHRLPLNSGEGSLLSDGALAVHQAPSEPLERTACTHQTRGPLRAEVPT